MRRGSKEKVINNRVTYTHRGKQKGKKRFAGAERQTFMKSRNKTAELGWRETETDRKRESHSDTERGRWGETGGEEERESERQRQTDRQRQRKGERGGERGRGRDRERDTKRERERERVSNSNNKQNKLQPVTW